MGQATRYRRPQSDQLLRQTHVPNNLRHLPFWGVPRFTFVDHCQRLHTNPLQPPGGLIVIVRQ
jgi:hypothetical protein